MTTDHQAQVEAAREECKLLLNQAKAGFCPSYYEKQEQAIDRLAALASPAPAASELVAGYMPTYGQIPWQALIDAVSEAQIGKPGLWKPDEGCFVGHVPVTMNMNSLNRIVSKFAAPQPPAAMTPIYVCPTRDIECGRNQTIWCNDCPQWKTIPGTICGTSIQAPAPVASESVAFCPAYELDRLRSGHNANIRSAKFGPSALDGDLPLYTAQPLPPDADDPLFRKCFEEAVKASNYPLKRKGERYASTYTDAAFLLAFGTVNRLRAALRGEQP